MCSRHNRHCWPSGCVPLVPRGIILEIGNPGSARSSPQSALANSASASAGTPLGVAAHWARCARTLESPSRRRSRDEPLRWTKPGPSRLMRMRNPGGRHLPVVSATWPNPKGRRHRHRRLLLGRERWRTESAAPPNARWLASRGLPPAPDGRRARPGRRGRRRPSRGQTAKPRRPPCLPATLRRDIA